MFAALLISYYLLPITILFYQTWAFPTWKVQEVIVATLLRAKTITNLRASWVGLIGWFIQWAFSYFSWYRVLERSTRRALCWLLEHKIPWEINQFELLKACVRARTCWQGSKFFRTSCCWYYLDLRLPCLSLKFKIKICNNLKGQWKLDSSLAENA